MAGTWVNIRAEANGNGTRNPRDFSYWQILKVSHSFNLLEPTTWCNNWFSFIICHNGSSFNAAWTLSRVIVHFFEPRGTSRRVKCTSAEGERTVVLKVFLTSLEIPFVNTVCCKLKPRIVCGGGINAANSNYRVNRCFLDEDSLCLGLCRNHAELTIFVFQVLTILV